MPRKQKDKQFWTGVPPWLFIGAVLILFPIFAYMTMENINSQKKNAARLLLEKGAALIRSFEAGTRTGVGAQWAGFKLQRLLVETAQQPDIAYIVVTDGRGVVFAHSKPSQIGKRHGENISFTEVINGSTLNWQVVRRPDGKNIFEVYRRFMPALGGEADMLQHHMMQRWFEEQRGNLVRQAPEDLVIFIGLNMHSIEMARKADSRHTVIMAAILLLIGFSGIILLFLTHRYRATRASLSRIKAFSDILVENMPIGLIAVDSEKRIVSINQVAEEVLDISPDDIMVGQHGADVLPERLWMFFNRLGRKEDYIEKQIECELANGDSVPLEITATILRDEEDFISGGLMLFKDISEVKSLKSEIIRSQRLATVGRLATGIAHEIRNPLSSIKGFATYFKERYRDVPEDVQIATIMTQEVERLNRVVSQLLEFSRPVAVSKKVIDIRGLIENSLKLIESQATQSKIKRRVDLSAEVESAYLDPDKISQVLLNLYLNAIDSMGEGGRLSVSVEKDADRDRVIIKITDTGIGIDAEDIPRVFDPYFTTKASGTGLGLAIVHNIMEAHGGQINVESQVGKGTEFVLSFPEMKIRGN
ncbi:MAG: PAS domain-containing protein [Desulfobacterales bacterium]|nr:PAS domain-containing protein [Desulfobacterales bacterium]